jgi:hypothetical protein
MELFNLIQGLSLGERRFIKQMAGDSSERYMALFDAIYQQQEPDEKALKEQFQAQGWFPNFSEAKRALREIVFRGLRRYHESRNPHFQVMDMIKEVEILFYKSELDLASRRLKQAKAIAYEADLKTLLLLIFTWERRLMMYYPNREHPDRWLQEMQDLLGKLSNHFDIVAMQWRSTDLVREYGYPTTDPQALEILDNTEAMIEEKLDHRDLELFERFAMSYVQMINQIMRGNVREAYNTNAAVIQQIDQVAPLHQAEKLHSFINIFNHQMTLADELHDFEGVLQYAQKLRDWVNKPYLKKERNQIDIYVRYIWIDHELRAHFMLQNEEEVWARIHEGEEYLKGIPENHKFSHFLKLHIAQIYIGLGEWKAAKRLILELINRHDLRPDIISDVAFLRLIAEYNLGNLDIADHLVLRTRRFLQKESRLKEEDQELLQLFKRLFYTSTGSERREALAYMKAYLEEQLETTSKTKSETELLFFITWVESQLQEVVPIQIVKQVFREKVPVSNQIAQGSS